jgi:class 3 adenylate cyclase
MQCSRCHHENAAEAKFCGECGGRLEAACASCGAANPPGNKFCQQCGTALGGAPEAGAATDTRFASPDTYTPSHLARKILTARSSLAGERKKVTVLFADLKGSLELLADRDPEDARVLLDGVLERMMEAVHRYEGTVNQVMGDGIMALFGAPVAHEDHAVRACYAALRMSRSISRYAEELRRRQGVDVQIRVGLNSGDVVVRSIGSDLNMDYSAVGQTTHLAARMEQLARPGTILITDATRRLADRYIEVEGHGPVPVKGMKQPVEVFELTGAAPASRVQASGGALTRFLGREEELSGLDRLLEEAAAGAGRAVGVAGEAGVGKSRLVWEFTRSSRAQAFLLLEAPAVAYAKATPYAPVTAMLRGYFQVEASDDGAKIRAKVTTRLLELDSSLHWAVPAILSLGNLATDDAEWEGLEPIERRRRIFAAVTRIVLREAERQPVLLVVENLDSADSETAALVDTLVDEIPPARVLLLASYRSDHRPAWRERPHASEVRLTPLGARSAEALVEEFLGRTPELQPLTRMLVERTGGNALFIEESVRSLIENEVLVGDRGAYRLAKPLASIQIPDRVQAVLAARIDRLPDERKTFLQTGAVIGKDLPFSLLQAVAGVPADQLLGNLTELEEAQFLHTTSLYPDLAYSFRHALTHDVVYSSLLKEQRRNLHARIVDALEALYPDRRTEHVERLAHHALGAELWFEAVGYLREAAGKAVARWGTCRRPATRSCRPSTCGSTCARPSCSSAGSRRSARCRKTPPAWPSRSATRPGRRAPTRTSSTTTTCAASRPRRSRTASGAWRSPSGWAIGCWSRWRAATWATPTTRRGRAAWRCARCRTMPRRWRATSRASRRPPPSSPTCPPARGWRSRWPTSASSTRRRRGPTARAPRPRRTAIRTARRSR